MRSLSPASPLKSSSPESTSLIDHTSPQTRSSVLKRSNTGSALTRSRVGQHKSRHSSHFGNPAWNEILESSSNSLNDEDDGDEDNSDDQQEWGLSKDMELFEVSAKDDTGDPSVILSHPLCVCADPILRSFRHPKPFQQPDKRNHRKERCHRARE
jgi:hypothetical protein